MKNHCFHATFCLTLTAALLLIGQTSPAAAECDFWSCTFGCCDENDQCHTEWSPEYCGYYGEDCAACEYPTPYCVFEIGYVECVACNIVTCPFGCCDEQGGCHDDQDPNYCGYYGEDCVACELPDPYCFNEGVYAQCTPCNVFTCPTGCCGSDGYCHTDNDPNYCGLAGLECSTCSGNTPNCIAGICSGCDAILCATGCCAADNVCHTENNEQYCGIAGTDCGVCEGDTPNCYNGWCVGCSEMFPCASGCCDLRTSLCETGDSNELCGGVGELCDNCEVDQLFCQNGDCIACNPSTCGSGCCDTNGACKPGTENNFCGTGGGECVNCVSTGEICVEYDCEFPDDDDDDNDDNDDNDIEACGLDNCLSGCCLNDQCWPGDLDDKCGKHAAQCQDCEADGEVCVDYECVAPDDDDTSPDDDDESPADDDESPTDDDDDDDNDDNDNDDASADDDESPTGGVSGDDDNDSGGCSC